MLERKIEIVKSIEGLVASKLPLMRTDCWQPSDFVPDLAAPDWVEQLQAFRAKAQFLSNELLVILVGTMVTEEALPNYQTSFNRLCGIGDQTGVSSNPWARWSRMWTAEENRHGDLLNRYLYLTGRVQMRSIEVTIQYLLRNGFDPRHDNDPYNGLIYTSFQEQATRISHAKVGALARKCGEDVLGRICNTIAGDEARHEDAYRTFAGAIFKEDPSGAVIALEHMFSKTITMPAALMSDGSEHNVFAAFSTVAQRNGVYTFLDYIEIMEQLLKKWQVESLTGLTAEAARAQEAACRLPGIYRRRIGYYEKKLAQNAKPVFSWVQ